MTDFKKTAINAIQPKISNSFINGFFLPIIVYLALRVK